MKTKMKDSKKIVIAYLIILAIFIILTILSMISKEMYNSCVDAKGLNDCFTLFCTSECQTPFYNIVNLLWAILAVSLLWLISPVFLISYLLCRSHEKKKEKYESINNQQ